MAQYIYTMNRVSKLVPPKRVILRDISLSFFPGAKIGVLGLNGAGKSTLLKIMAGIDTGFDGEARPQSGIRIGFLSQEPQLDAAKDVRTTVMEGLGETFRQVEEFNRISERFGESLEEEEMNALLERQAQLQDAIDAAAGWELERKLEIAADALRLPPWEASIATLSGGERRRVALCRLLLSTPDMLLLDEPTNHLDAESVAWLERYLEQQEISGGLDMIRVGAYETPSRAYVGRFNFRGTQQQQLIGQLSGGERNETNEIYIPPGERLGDLVIEVERLRKGYGERLLIDNLSFRMPRGAIVGIIGPNGAGKTTLFRMLTGGEPPDAGTIRLGESVRLAYVDQSRQALDDGKAGDLRRPRHDPGRRLRDALARLRRALQFPRHAAAAADRAALRRGAQPRAPRQGAARRRQRAAAR